MAASSMNNRGDEPEIKRCLFYMSQQKLPADDHIAITQMAVADEKEGQGCVFHMKVSVNYEIEYLPHHQHMNLKSTKSPSFCIHSSLLLDDTRVDNAVRKIFLNQPLSEHDFDSMVKIVSSKAKSIKNDPRNAGKNVLHIVMSLRVIWVREFNPDVQVAWERLLPEGQVFSFNLPATERSIEQLDRVIFDKECCLDQEQNCAICLREFKFGDQVTGMPCLHWYHGECILRWLQESGCCPSCRFPLPVCNVLDGPFRFLKRKWCTPSPPLSDGRIRTTARMSVRYNVY